MIDPTNIPVAFEQAGNAVAAGRSFWMQWGPTIAIAAMFVVSTLDKFNAWVARVIVFVETRGGFGQMILKMIWNPQVKFRPAKGEGKPQ